MTFVTTKLNSQIEQKILDMKRDGYTLQQIMLELDLWPSELQIINSALNSEIYEPSEICPEAELDFD